MFNKTSYKTLFYEGTTAAITRVAIHSRRSSKGILNPRGNDLFRTISEPILVSEQVIVDAPYRASCSPCGRSRR